MNTTKHAPECTFPLPRLDVLRGAPIYVARCGMKPRFSNMWGAMEYERGYYQWPNFLSSPGPEAQEGWDRRAKEQADEFWMQTQSEAQA